jgi:hypothetical protein
MGIGIGIGVKLVNSPRKKKGSIEVSYRIGESRLHSKKSIKGMIDGETQEWVGYHNWLHENRLLGLSFKRQTMNVSGTQYFFVLSK